jgi:hypothetical protein
VEGEGVISNRTAQNWFKRFNEGDTSLKDEPCSGRPVTVDSKALHEAVGANPATSTADCLLNSTFYGCQLFGIFINSARSRNIVEKRHMN